MTKPPDSFALSSHPALLLFAVVVSATTVATTLSTLVSTSRDAVPVACECSCEQAPAAIPQAVPPMELEGRGTLDREAIRGVVREHIDDIRYCYNSGLRDDPALAGRVQIAFTIAESGATSHVREESTTLPSPSVVACMVEAVDRWTFPAPVGGEVEVVYPFVLEPG